MIMRISDRLNREDKGFTLIELMVVVLIIAILIAIAIPTFLGARKRAQNRAAQANLRQTITSAKVIFTDQEDYTNATDAALQSAEPAITFSNSTTPSSGPPTVSVNPFSVDHFYAAAWSKATVCWYVRDVTTTTVLADAGRSGRRSILGRRPTAPRQTLSRTQEAGRRTWARSSGTSPRQRKS